ncbi:hypothetical protein [Nostoc favosum]|uniref:Uncharacterized protein n=1 Tax=Nostoc favosum CHAB5714 TaxID=2780399 RepID=A0ABS8I634_9NOSO|nr:hypothetical protein [Nostoc favosum]MCC5599326.1 hypothetical protein [Nostoc favosum CHAB5714]
MTSQKASESKPLSDFGWAWVLGKRGNAAVVKASYLPVKEGGSICGNCPRYLKRSIQGWNIKEGVGKAMV